MAPAALHSNPFVAGGVIKDRRLFVGRKSELDELTNCMTGAQSTSVNIHGPRRIGKSSLLYHFWQTWPDRVTDYRKYAPVFISLEGEAGVSKEAFLGAVARELLELRWIGDIGWARSALNPPPKTLPEFGRAVEVFSKNGILPVICLDEFEKWLEHTDEFDNDFYSYLRGLLNLNHMMMIITSKEKLTKYRHRYGLTSPFFNLVYYIPLGPFTKEEAEELVRLPAGREPGAVAVLSADEQRFALQLGKRHPYKLQMACRLLVEARNHGKDFAWVRRRFDDQVANLPEPKDAARVLSRKARRVARFAFLDVPIALGGWARLIGVRKDDLMNWLFGVLTIVVIVLVVLGVVAPDKVADLIRSIGW